MSAGTVSVAIRDDLYAEFILRCRRSVDVSECINTIVENYLDRTRDDSKIWSSERATHADDIDDEKFRKTYGNPQRGYQWHPIFLPNGAQVRMTYQTKPHYAEIKHEKVVYNGKSLSPSQLARTIANGTNRNAWRDLWIKLPNSASWILADDMRRAKLPQRSPLTAEALRL